jgi:cell wall-associated NlpC family hydrolase
MNKRIPIIAGLICCTILVVPAGSFSQEPAKNNATGIISAPLANVHEEPLPKSVHVTQVLMADEVRILEKQDYRYRISIPSQGNQEGWIQQEAVSLPRDKGQSYLNTDRTWIVIAVPKTEALILDKTGNHKVPLYAGTRLPVLETDPDGIRVQFPDRSVAIIDPADTVAVRPPDPVLNDTSPDDIVKTARKFRGVRYLDGGLTTQGLDTRGLIYVVYRIYGMPLAMDRASLLARGEKISKKDLQPGDILFFSGESEGLYLGNGRFLRSAKKSSVQVAGIYDRRYANALQYGLRVLGSDPGQNKTLAAMTADEVLLAQARSARLPLGKRISYWAGRFIGTPYDTDPLGLYVRTNRIVADEKADCMYQVFRSVELAQSGTPGEAVNRALDLRFTTRGVLVDGLVTNYDQRFQYGEDMVYSGKWGKNITADLGTTTKIPGSRGRDEVDILPKRVLATRTLQKKLQDGDIIYWVKDPKKRSGLEEIVAHLSIVHIKSGKPHIIHAAGSKNQWGTPNGGRVKEVSFADYVRNMHFTGAFVTRFEQ